MLSIEECRKKLGNNSVLTDEEVINVRNMLYAVANIAINSFRTEVDQHEKSE